MTNMPKTINQLIKILAYNDWPWEDGPKYTSKESVHGQDKPTCTSLAEAQYPWTERQAKLAIVLCKRYKTKFESHGLNIDDLIKKPKYEEPFRVINSSKIIEQGLTQEGSEEALIVKFPYTKKVINLLRCLRAKKGLPENYFHYDGESKTWTIKKTDVTTYYIVTIGVRYNFDFTSSDILDQYVEIKKEKCKFKKPIAYIEKNKLSIKNCSESLKEYWTKHIQNKKMLHQLDTCKNFGVWQKGIKVKAYTKIADRIAHNPNNLLWIDKSKFNKDEVIAGLCELDCFPLIMPVSGDVVDSIEDTLDMQQWIKCFERHGFQENNLSFGFEFKEPKFWKDKDWDEKLNHKINNWKKRMDEETWQIGYDLYQMSKSFKTLTTDTKIYFVRNKLTRSYQRSNIVFKGSLTAIGGGFYHTGGEKMKRLLDNLPKKLYYSTSQPLSYQWKDRAINKL